MQVRWQSSRPVLLAGLDSDHASSEVPEFPLLLVCQENPRPSDAFVECLVYCCPTGSCWVWNQVSNRCWGAAWRLTWYKWGIEEATDSIKAVLPAWERTKAFHDASSLETFSRIGWKETVEAHWICWGSPGYFWTHLSLRQVQHSADVSSCCIWSAQAEEDRRLGSVDWLNRPSLVSVQMHEDCCPLLWQKEIDHRRRANG